MHVCRKLLLYKRFSLLVLLAPSFSTVGFILHIDWLETPHKSLYSSDEISAQASTKSTAKGLKVLVKPSWNPLKSLGQSKPVRVTVDIGYRYTGSGSNAKFSSISNVTSYSLGVPTDWN